MPEPLRVALVGCNIGRSHIEEAYHPLPEFAVAAVCDLDAARLDKVADEFAVPVRTTNFDDLLAMDVDIIDICTPPTTHKPMILAALAAGKHVVCEKPLVGSLGDADAIIAAEKTSRGKLMPIFQYRWGDGAQKAKALIESGLCGKPFVATAETHWKRDAVYYDNPWRGRWASELGGVLMTHAIHMHDMVCWLLGPVERVFARVDTRVNAIETEDCVSSSWLLASGALVTSSCTLGSAVEISRLRLCFENLTIESGVAPYAPADDPWTFTAGSDAIAAQVAEVLARFVPAGRRFGGQMRAFAAALAAGDPPPVTTADARRSLELNAAFYASAASGRDVALPLPADHPGYVSLRPAA